MTDYSMTLHEWFAHHHRDMLGTFKLNGIPVMKNPLDLMVYMEIIQETRPDIIIEIGTAFGGSALFFRYMLNMFGALDSYVISVDITDERRKVDAYPGIIFITGDSNDLETIEMVRDYLDPYYDVMIAHDGNHNKENVLKDLRAYGPLVTPGQYFVVEDGIQDTYKGMPCSDGSPGPLAAVEEFLKENSTFTQDRWRERFMITYNPGGYLKRVKP